jgi:hypothetical protein
MFPSARGLLRLEVSCGYKESSRNTVDISEHEAIDEKGLCSVSIDGKQRFG